MRFANVLACALLSTAFLASAQGCIISKCDDGRPNCTEFETPVRYEGSEETQSVAWTAGTAIRVVSVNGQVDVKQGSGTEVSATFQPFILEEDSGEDRAREAMEEDLVVEVTDEGGTIVVKSSRKEGSSGALGADIVVSLPAAFDGAFEVAQNNGSVTVDLSGSTPLSTTVVNDGAGDLAVFGARGKLTVTADVGDVDLTIAEWSTENGSVFTDNGDIDITVPRAADGTLILVGDAITEEGVPETWTSDGAGTYTMNAGMGGTVDVTSDFGDVHLFVE
jgi:hypothetical protein